VQDRGKADLRAEAPARDRLEGLGRGGEEQGVGCLGVGEEEALTTPWSPDVVATSQNFSATREGALMKNGSKMGR
jgi:hypothetical protein